MTSMTSMMTSPPLRLDVGAPGFYEPEIGREVM